MPPPPDRRRRKPVTARQTMKNVAAGGDVYQVQYIGSAPSLDDALDRIAAVVFGLLQREVGLRDLDNPLSIRVRPAGSRADGEGAEWRTDEDGLAVWFDQAADRRLVLLGEPGAGKSAQAMLLARRLADPDRRRTAPTPVPVFLSLSSWLPVTSLSAWMTERLLEEFPFLTDMGLDVERELVGSGRLVPILDGLDEVPVKVGKEALRGLELALPRSTPFVLTCRTAEYDAAVAESGIELDRTTVAVLQPVRASDSVAYLRGKYGDHPPWMQLLAQLGEQPGGPLAQALSTPLMLYLLGATHRGRPERLAWLLDESVNDSAAHIENRLLDEFIPARYERAEFAPVRDGRRRAYAASDAVRWLSTLASGPRELRWWDVRSAAMGIFAGLLLAVASGVIFNLVWNPYIAVIGALAVWIATEVVNRSYVAQKAEIVLTEREAADPRLHMRRYRILSAVAATVIGGAVGAALGGWLSASLGASATTAWWYGTACGLLFGLATLITTAWGTYFGSRLWLAARRRLPLRLMEFLEDAHQRGVLRRPSAAYQFRHARLQDRLFFSSDVELQRSAPRRVLPSTTPRIRIFALLLKVPLLRLLTQLYAILLPTVILTALMTTVAIEYESGAQPREATHTYCSSQSCTAVSAWHWQLAPQAVLDAGFSHGSRPMKVPFHGFKGTIHVGGCDGAWVEMAVTADGVAAGTHRLPGDRDVNLENVGWSLPADFDRLTITFRRLDPRSCTADISWEQYALSLDGLFTARSRVGGPQDAMEVP